MTDSRPSAEPAYRRETFTVRWYLSRLGAMSPAEVVYRIGRAARTVFERLIWRLSPEDSRRRSGVPQSPGRTLTSVPREIEAPATFEPFDAESFKSVLPEVGHRIVQSAERIREGRLTVFGRPVQIDKPSDWHRDPATGAVWPKSFWADIDIRGGLARGGPLWVWELNRHHHLDLLARASALTEDGAYAEVLLEQLLGWSSANPRWTGVNWSSSLEMSVRLINWCWALDVIGHKRIRTWHGSTPMRASIAEQAAHVFRHLSRYSSANNHLMGEAAGLAIVGVSFPDMFDARRWSECGFSILAEEIPKQIYPDGVPAEQAVAYLAFILELNLWAWQVAARRELEVPPVWPDRLGAAADFLTHIMDTKGQVPMIGDSADASVLGGHDQPATTRFRPILAAAATALNRPDLKRAAGKWDELPHLIFGAEGESRFDAIPDHLESPGSKLFPEGGYAIMRDEECVIVFDCGPLGYLSTAAHGHADALSVWLHRNGEPVLVDSGTFAYQEGQAWRTFFRGTSAHNTVLLDGEDQSQQLGGFLWGRKAVTRLIRWETNKDHDLAVAEHDGYRPRGVIHRRSVLFVKPNVMLVVDDLVGQGRHRVQQLWHFPPHARISRADPNLDIQVGRASLEMSLIDPSGLEIHISAGETSPIQGWVSESYGQKSAAPVVDVRGRLDLPARLSTIFRFAPASASLGDEPTEVMDSFERLLGKDVTG